MSIVYCKRCDDHYDSDAYPEPLCKVCMGRITTFAANPPRRAPWTAYFNGAAGGMIGVGRTEESAIANLISNLRYR